MILFFDCVCLFSYWVLIQLFHSLLSPSSKGSLVPSVVFFFSSQPFVCCHLITKAIHTSHSNYVFSFRFSKLLSVMYSAQKSNKLGDKIQPWCISFPDLYQFVVPCPIPTAVSWPSCTFPRKQVQWSGILISLRIFHNLLWPTQSKGFPGSSIPVSRRCPEKGNCTLESMGSQRVRYDSFFIQAINRDNKVYVDDFMKSPCFFYGPNSN